MSDTAIDQIGVNIFKTAPTLAIALRETEGDAALVVLAGSLGIAPEAAAILQALTQSKDPPFVFEANLKKAEEYWLLTRGAKSSAPDDLRAQHEQQSRRHETTARRLAYIVTFGFFLLIAMLLLVVRFPVTANGLTGELQSQFRDVLLTMTGVVGTSWAGIISFYFGSSVGSRLQNDTLGQIAQHGTDTRTPPGPVKIQPAPPPPPPPPGPP